jgi:hypothetical protein
MSGALLSLVSRFASSCLAQTEKGMEIQCLMKYEMLREHREKKFHEIILLVKFGS